jgi:hypothetical protein
MSKNFDYPHAAYCPYLENKHMIFVNYAEIPIAGKSSPEYKKMGYSCNQSENCPQSFRDEHGRCQVFLQAPNQPL